MSTDDDAPDAFDALVPDPVFGREIGVTSMTLYRRDRDPKSAEVSWPVKIPLNGRNYRSRRDIERYKYVLRARAIAKREEQQRCESSTA